MAITPIPALDRTSPTFRDDVDAFFGTQLPAFSVEAEAARAEVSAKQVIAFDSAAIALAAEESVATNSAAAQAAALAAQSAAGLPALPGAGQLLKTQGATNIITGAAALTANTAYECDTSAAAFTATLPAAPVVGDWVALTDHAGTFAANNLTVSRNGLKIQSLAEDLIIDINNISVLLVYINAAKGWAVK